MTTYGSTVPEHGSHVDLWLVAVVGLAAALVALGSWVLIDRFTGPERDATTLIDDLNAAWSAGDAEAVATFFAPDAVMTRDDGQQTVGVDAISGLVPMTEASDFQVERVAPVTVEGDFATTFMRYTSVSAGGTEVGVFQLEAGKILRYWFFKLGVTPPFDNAVSVLQPAMRAVAIEYGWQARHVEVVGPVANVTWFPRCRACPPLSAHPPNALP